MLALAALVAAPVLALSGVDNLGSDVDNLTGIATGTGGEVFNYYDINGPVVFNQAAAGFVVTYFAIEMNPGQSGIFYVHLNDGATVISGSANYGVSYAGFLENFYYTLDSANHTFTGLSSVFVTKTIKIGYMVSDAGTDDQQYYIALSRIGVWGTDEPVLLYPVSGSPSDNPIVQVDFTPGDKVPRIYTHINSWQEISDAEAMAEGRGNTWIDWIIELSGSFWDMLNLFWGIFSFFFIENLLLMILIIEGTILAYRFNTSKNVFLALSRVASDNQRLLTGIIGFIQMIVGFVWDLVNLINPMRWIFGK